ncbi:retron system putative HNH endonuclease [Fusobacterium sp.]|uniref:retron system putative HNH endonuclease n=1 Tax=Fusobacterium sp. TaxID=68766 RepID=UPI00262EBA11|nr:retron system putative HNH endonuclease [Fusobacterium sp.]
MSLRNKKNILKYFEEFKTKKLRNDYDSLIDSLDFNKKNSNEIKEILKEKLNKSRFNEKNFFDSKAKNQLKKKLLEEQGYVCIYCQKRIVEDDNISIEHIRPKSLYGKLEFDYFNLAISCNIKGKESTCDPRKKDKELLAFHTCNLEKDIIYNLNGEISSNNPDLEKDIKLLNLNKITLKRKRLAALRGFLYQPIKENGKIKKKLIKYKEDELKYIAEQIKEKNFGQYFPYYMFVSKNLNNLNRIKEFKEKAQFELELSRKILNFLQKKGIDEEIITEYKKEFCFEKYKGEKL